VQAGRAVVDGAGVDGRRHGRVGPRGAARR
jgi:hypothetical protein